MSRSNRAKFQEALDRLEAALRSAPMTVDEISSILGCSPMTARKRVHRLSARVPLAFTAGPKKIATGPAPTRYFVRSQNT